MSELTDMQLKAEKYRQAFDALIDSGTIEGYRCAPPRKRKLPAAMRGKSRVLEWLLLHVDYSGKKCLFWPFSKDRGHAGCFGYCGKMYKATRVMCTLANGPPATAELVAGHSCARGHRGCISPEHLEWRTQSENNRAQVKEGRLFHGRQGKITFAKAAEIRAIGRTRLLADIADEYGISPQRVSGILRGLTFTREVKPWRLSAGRYYSKIVFKGRCHSLGGHDTSAEATAAYHLALDRLRRGEAAVAPKRSRPSAVETRRFFVAPPAKLTFEGDKVLAVSVDPEQDQSTFMLHNALNDLHPSVKKFVIVASQTGDLIEAGAAAGLTPEQLALLLPKLRTYLQRHLQ